MDHSTHNKIVTFIWSITDDCLKDESAHYKYRDIILPMFVLSRLDCLLESSKADVSEEKRFQREDADMTDLDPISLREASGYVFYNTSRFTLKTLLDNHTQLEANLKNYLDGFSDNVQEIIDKFDLRNQIRKMAQSDMLHDVIEKFVSEEINLSPDFRKGPDGCSQPSLSNKGMVYVFKKLIGKFNEEDNKEVSEHFTPRKVITLMTAKKKTNGDPPKFSQATLQRMLLKNDYSFPDSNFEPSSNKPIGKAKSDEKKLSLKVLQEYLNINYGTGNTLKEYDDHIEKIIGRHRFNKYNELIELRANEIKKFKESEKTKNLKNLKESEESDNLRNIEQSDYYKALTHFTILSKVKQGSFNLFVTSPTRTSKPSLSDNPSRFAVKDSKKLHDAIIRCFYSRLIQGMTEQEKERYQILLPHDFLPTRFDKLLCQLDKAIQDIFCALQKNIDGYQDETSLPDKGLDEAINLTRYVLNQIFNKYPKEGYISNTLRITLLKFATLNRAINDIDAIFDIHKQIINNLPNDIQRLKQIKSKSKIKSVLLDIFTKQPKKFPEDLIECAELVCKMYIITSIPYEATDEAVKAFNEIHMEPYCIAVSAALLYQDFLRKEKLELNIRGEQNKHILIYKTLSILSKKVLNEHSLITEILWHYGLSEELFKYLVTRYSISVFGLSDAYSSQIGATAHLNVKIKKFELQREAYELLKDMSVEDACLCISDFCNSVDTVIKMQD